VRRIRIEQVLTFIVCFLLAAGYIWYRVAHMPTLTDDQIEGANSRHDFGGR
jgi:hypothetical protein